VFTHNDQTTITSQLTAGASFGWGPFSISGSYSEANSNTTVNAHYDGTTLTIAQPQIIAYTGFLVPKCPDPLPAGQLPWGDDAVLPSSLTPKDLADVVRARSGDVAFLRAAVQRQAMLSDAADAQALQDIRRANQLKGLYEASLMADSQRQQKLAGLLVQNAGAPRGSSRT
jgi:hypothetical protein